MKAIITYKDQDLEPTGIKKAPLDNLIIEELFQIIDTNASIDFEYEFKYISEISLSNLLFLDYATKDKYHIEFNIDVNNINIDDDWFKFNLFYDIIDKTINELSLIHI